MTIQYEITDKFINLCDDSIKMLVSYFEQGLPLLFTKVDFIDAVSGLKNLDCENDIFFEFSINASLISKSQDVDEMYFISHKSRTKIVDYYYNFRDRINKSGDVNSADNILN